MEPTRYIWMDGDLVPWEEAQVHVLVHALHYGTGVFEGIRAYETADGPAIFRLGEHMDRLVNSAKAYGIPLDLNADQLSKAAKETFLANGLQHGYLRPLVFYGTGSIGLNPDGASVHTIIATWEWGAYLGEEGVANGIRVGVSSWRRIDQNQLIPNAKGTGGYLNSVLAKTEAVRSGYDEAVMLNHKGYVAEGSGENLFLVRQGHIVSPPVTDGSLDGITADSVCTLLTDAGHTVERRHVTRSDMYYADEAFFTGTAAEVTPIREIDDRDVGDGKPGPVTRQAQQLFMDAVSGKLPEYRRWLDLV